MPALLLSAVTLLLTGCVGSSSTPTPRDHSLLHIEKKTGFEIWIDGRRIRDKKISLKAGWHVIEVGGPVKRRYRDFTGGVSPSCRTGYRFSPNERYRLDAELVETDLGKPSPRDADWTVLEARVTISPMDPNGSSSRHDLECENACRVRAHLSAGRTMSATCDMYPVYQWIRDTCQGAYSGEALAAIRCERSFEDAMISINRRPDRSLLVFVPRTPELVSSQSRSKALSECKLSAGNDAFESCVARFGYRALDPKNLSPWSSYLP